MINEKFEVMTTEETMAVDGGIGPIAVVAIIAGCIFVAGAVKGCTDEAANDSSAA